MELLASLFVGAATLISLISNPVASVSPIKIKSCEVAYLDAGGGVATSSLQYTNGVTLTIMNPTPKTVTNFTVSGSYNKYHVTDSWAGTMMPGAQLSIFKHYAQLAYVDSKAECHVTKVTFSDGTSWTGNAP